MLPKASSTTHDTWRRLSAHPPTRDRNPDPDPDPDPDPTRNARNPPTMLDGERTARRALGAPTLAEVVSSPSSETRTDGTQDQPC